MLSTSEIEQYHRDGYVIPDYRLDATIIDEIKTAHDRLLDKHPEFVDYCPALLAYDRGFLNIGRHPDLVAMVDDLIGPNFALWNSSFFAKPAHVGTKTPFHQDGRYWPIDPLASCSIWIAIDAATTANGCLRFIPGSHRRRELAPHEFNDAEGLSLPLEIDTNAYDETTAVDIVLEPGQISLHDIFLVHGSEANTSDQPRRGMTLRYMPTSSVYRRDQADGRRNGPLSMAERTLYLMSGHDESGRNDFVVRY